MVRRIDVLDRPYGVCTEPQESITKYSRSAESKSYNGEQPSCNAEVSRAPIGGVTDVTVLASVQLALG